MRKLLLFFALVLSAVALRAADLVTVTWTFNDATLSSNKTDNRYTGSLSQTTSTDGTWNVALSTNSKQKDGSNGVRIGANGNTFKQGDYIELSETKNPIPATAKITSVTFDVKGNAKGSALSMDLYLGGIKVGTTQSFSSSNSATTFKWDNLSYTGNVVKFIIAADASYGSHLKTITITYEEDGGGDDPDPQPVLGTYTPTFDNVSLTVGEIKTITAPAQDGKDAPAVTFYSENESCVTVGENGTTLTAVAAGTASISLLWDADDNWNGGVIENAFTVTVTAADEPGPQPSAGTYKLVKSTADLTPGAKYIIAYYDASSTPVVSKSMSTSTKSSKFQSVDVNISNEKLTPADASLILTLGGDLNNGWTFKTDNLTTNGWLTVGTNTNLTAAQTECKLEIAVDDKSKKASISLKSVTTGKRYVGYNYNNGSPYFGSYSDGNAANVYLYKEVTDSKEDYKPIFADLIIEKGESKQVTLTSDNATETKTAPQVKYAVTAGADYVTIEGTTVTATAKGNATVTASWDADDNWTAGTATFGVTVTEHIDPQLVWVYYKSEAEPRVEFTTRSIDVKDDASRARTSVICKASPETQLAGITYSSSDENVAMIDENSGEIVLMAGGKTTIKAHFAGDDTYKADDAEYTLTVTTTPEMAWAIDKTVNVNSELTLSNIFAMDNEETLLPLVQFTSTDPEIAEVTGGKLVTKKAGYVTVTATLPRGAHEMYTGTSEAVSFMVIDPQANDFTFDFTIENPYGTTTQSSGTAEYFGTNSLNVDMGNITLEVSGKARHFKSVSGENSANNLWLYSADATYAAGQLAFICPDDYEITSITFHRANVAAAEWNFACDDETMGQIADNKEGNTILSKTWTPAEDTYQQIVMFTATGNARFSAIDVTVAPLPAAAEPEMSMSATSVTFKAKHPSHELYVVAFKGVYNPAKSAANRAAAAVLDEQPDLDGTANWTKAEGISHTHEFSNAAEGEIYSVLAKSIDKKGSESPVVWRLYDDSGDITGIEDIAADAAADNVEYYNVQGMRLSVAPATGIYFERRGNTVTKRAAR